MMKLIFIYIAIMVASTTGEIAPEIDWLEVDKLLSSLQSAVSRRNAGDMINPLKAMLDKVPSGTHHYMVGVSYGEQSGLSYESTEHLTGSHGTLGNPLINYNEDCVYVAKIYKGPHVYLSEGGEDIPSCKYDWWNLQKYTMFPIGLRPVVSYAKTVRTSLEPYSTGSNVLTTESKFFQEWENFATGVNLAEINMDTTEPDTIISVHFGIVEKVQRGSAKIRKFSTFATARIKVRTQEVVSTASDLGRCSGRCDNITAMYADLMANKKGGFFNHS